MLPSRRYLPLLLKGAVADRLRASPHLQHLVRHLHSLGPRPTAEAIAELLERANADPRVLDNLEAWTRLDARTVAAVGGRDFPRPRPRLVPPREDER